MNMYMESRGVVQSLQYDAPVHLRFSWKPCTVCCDVWVFKQHITMILPRCTFDMLIKN